MQNEVVRDSEAFFILILWNCFFPFYMYCLSELREMCVFDELLDGRQYSLKEFMQFFSY